MAIFWLFIFFAYFAPSVVALFREHPKAGTIFLLNLSFGWTIIGWIVCIIWAWGPAGKEFK